MNVQMLFSGPLFPELGSRPSLSKLSGSAPASNLRKLPKFSSDQFFCLIML